MKQVAKMRVLQIISSATTSGAEKHVLNLSELLTRNGHYVELICPPNGWLGEQCRAIGIPVFESEMRGAGWGRTLGLAMRRIREAKIDVVHSHLTRATYFGAISGLTRRRPAVATVHIANHDEIYRRMAFGRNRLVAVSNFVRGILHGRGIKDQFIDTVYNGTDFTDLQYNEATPVWQEFGIPQDRKVIGMVGRVCREKGHLLMVEALSDVVKRDPLAHVMFVGRLESQFEPELMEAVASANIESNVTFAGERHDVPRLLDSFAFTAMPSHQETFGVAAIEAMARKKAVVASRVGGLTEVVRHKQTGLLIDLRPDELSEAMKFMLQNESERHQMGLYGRALVEQRFTLKEMVRRLEGIYERSIS
ncbi:MAG: glycosyltransferase family 4 protein [Fimbriimonadaceae bacterium]